MLRREGVVYQHQRQPPTWPGGSGATVKAERGEGASTSTRSTSTRRGAAAEFARRAEKALQLEASVVEAAISWRSLSRPRKRADEEEEGRGNEKPAVPAMSEAERAEALALLRGPDLLDQLAADVDALGYVGEETNKRLLYFVAVSRKLADPLSAVILSQSGAGKSGITEVIETPDASPRTSSFSRASRLRASTTPLPASSIRSS